MLLAGIYLVFTQTQYTYHNWNTYESLSLIPYSQQYDLLILGSSHGRVFSSFGNHRRIENILDMHILNISKTAAGLLPEKALLSYFYQNGNNAKQIMYIIDPAIFYSDKWNENNYFLEDEPFYPNFFITAAKEGINYKVLENYLRSKFSFYWITGRHPVDDELSKDIYLTGIDPEKVAKRRAFLYSDGLKSEIFAHYADMLRDLVSQASKHNSKIIFILPPTLLGRLPGISEVVSLIKSMKKYFNVEIFDFSDTIKEPKLYQDHDHLNTPGIELFTKKYLKPILLNKK